MYFQTKADTKQ